MSGIYVLAARYAKWRYGARIHLHRSSRHILSQREILAQIPGAGQTSNFITRRELEGYDLADSIIVPSLHVVESFTPWPGAAAKLFLNPLGVNIWQFPRRTEMPPPDRPTVLFIGHWSYRKGVDVLEAAIKRLSGVYLVHVGAMADAAFPNDPRFTHHDYVPQDRLVEFHRKAHVFVLPSREDGFGVVLSQALSVGLPIVCTDRTGGPDLAKFPGLARFIRIVPAEDIGALQDAIAAALASVSGCADIEPMTEAEREMLGWKHYAVRDMRFMESKLGYATSAMS
jgi:glycosyltransferase involved in cell wall biosynthesis